jgi:membrane protease YdiL (CAAX protease family)
MGESRFSKLVLVSEGNSGLMQEIGRYVDLDYTFWGIGAAILILLMYRHMASKEKELIENLPQAPYWHEIWKNFGLEEINLEEFEATRVKLFIAIPVTLIALAELLIYVGRTNSVLIKLAIGIHIGVLIAFCLSHFVIKDLKIYRVYQALMFLPILRLVNLSMPVFFTTTLYVFVFTYAPVMIPLFIIAVHQRQTFKKKDITIKNFLTCIILSIYLSFLLGLVEYMILRPNYLIPDLSTENLLKLTFVMVFFVGLTEEFIFRSILQTRLEELLGIREVLIITGFLFGLMHSGYGNFYEILFTGFAGFMLGYSFYKTRSLALVAITHGLINVFLFGVFPHYMSSWIWV